ncbi:hypothetical protein BHM03_00015726 [Ensete ventricosum]|nr:hypothetical protein BHM03_00015726 [Ensete ventricosum]
MRHSLASWKDEVLPRPHSSEQGAASSPCEKPRQCLRSRMERRGDISPSFLYGKTRRRLALIRTWEDETTPHPLAQEDEATPHSPPQEDKATPHFFF